MELFYSEGTMNYDRIKEKTVRKKIELNKK